MPRGDGGESTGRGHDGQQGVAQDVPQECGEKCKDQQCEAPRHGQTKNLPGKEGNHETALEGTDTTAGLLNPKDTAGKEDEVPPARGFVAQPVQDLKGDRCVAEHQTGHHGLLEIPRPRYGDEEKKNRESEMQDPRESAS